MLFFTGFFSFISFFREWCRRRRSGGRRTRGKISKKQTNNTANKHTKHLYIIKHFIRLCLLPLVCITTSFVAQMRCYVSTCCVIYGAYLLFVLFSIFVLLLLFFYCFMLFYCYSLKVKLIKIKMVNVKLIVKQMEMQQKKQKLVKNYVFLNSVCLFCFLFFLFVWCCLNIN